MTFTVIFLVCALSMVIHGQSVSPSDCLVWGPGLILDAVLPVRYFFIQAVDDTGQNFTDSVGDKAFSVQVSDPSNPNDRARTWLQVLNRNDGSYIVRFKMFRSEKKLKIDVLHNGKHVADSPYILDGPVYHEQCYCPIGSTKMWLKNLQCPKTYQQIQADLSIHKEIDLGIVAKEAVKRFSDAGRHSLCHYKIIDNKIYRKTYGQHVGFKMFSDATFLSITRKVRLPDVEFFVNLGDWPLEHKAAADNPLPIFSWCGSDDTRDIIMPTYDVTESSLETMGRVSLDMLSVQANTGPKWENKTAKALFRGRDSRQERLDLVMLSKKHPDLIDAALTNMFFFKKDPEKYGEIVKHISFFDFFKFKYQINVDGTVAAYRLPYLMASDSVVLKQDSPFYEFFYKELKPFEHYIPIKRDLSDIMQKLQWAKDNDERAQQIAKNAQQYVRENVLAKDIFCYHVILFQEYAKLVKEPPVFDDTFELVEQPSDYESECDCHRENKAKKKKDEL